MSSPISVTITLKDASPKTADFGALAYFAKCPYAVNPRTYTCDSAGLAQMITDGFDTNSEAYNQLSTLAGQENGVDKLKVYPRDAGVNDPDLLLTPVNTTEGFRYTGTVEGKGGSIDVDYTVQNGDTADDICTAIVAQITSQQGSVITVSDNTDGAYTIVIDNEAFTFDASTDDIADIAAGLDAAFDGHADLTAASDATTVTVSRTGGGRVDIQQLISPDDGLAVTTPGEGPDVSSYVKATDNTGTLSLEPVVAGERIWIRNFVEEMTIKETATDAGIATDLAAGVAKDPGFYGFGVDSNSEAEINAAATWANANKRMFIGETLDTEVGSSAFTDVGTDVNQAGGNYAKVVYVENNKQHEGLCMLSKVFAQNAAFGFKFIQPDNCAAIDRTENFKGYLDNKNVGYLNLERGESYMTSTKFPGRYPDLTRGFDWLKDTIEADMLAVFLNAAKDGGVEFTNAGIGKFTAALNGVITKATGIGLLAKQPTPFVQTVLVSDVPTSEKTNRELKGLKLVGVLAGKVETLAIEVLVTP